MPLKYIKPANLDIFNYCTDIIVAEEDTKSYSHSLLDESRCEISLSVKIVERVWNIVEGSLCLPTEWIVSASQYVHLDCDADARVAAAAAVWSRGNFRVFLKWGCWTNFIMNFSRFVVAAQIGPVCAWRPSPTLDSSDPRELRSRLRSHFSFNLPSRQTNAIKTWLIDYLCQNDS